MGEMMTPDGSNSDFLEAAFRQSRAAVADAGFSLEVERQVVAWRRRRRLVRWLPLIMATIGLCLAAIFHGFEIPTLSFAIPRLPSMTGFANALAPAGALLSRFGIQPWMMCVGLLVLFISLLEGRRDQRSAFRL
jgi:hypothetical protein